jgi:hypothetical protein
VVLVIAVIVRVALIKASDIQILPISLCISVFQLVCMVGFCFQKKSIMLCLANPSSV